MTNESDPRPHAPPRWAIVLLLLGIYLSVRGYHSLDGDQAYRLPLLLHRQDPTLYADDPFVRAFDAYNPHVGALALLDAASRPLGLSAGLAGLFALTFAVTCLSLDRLCRAVWPEEGCWVGLVGVGLVLAAKAGNIGTNHLFEAMLLDRLMGFALGWFALAVAIARPERGLALAPMAIGVATLIHPSVGLQLGLVLATSWIAWELWPGASEAGWRRVALGLGLLALAMAPGLAMTLGQGARLFRGLPPDEFRRLSLEIQGPQHLLPHLWRLPQWLAWGCYPILAILALGRFGLDGSRRPCTPARVRLGLVLAVNLAGLGIAWWGIEVLDDVRIALFQPFRMATLARGLALGALSGRVVAMWRRGRALDRIRATMLAVGMGGDWALVVATAFDASLAAFESARSCLGVRTATEGVVDAQSAFPRLTAKTWSAPEAIVASAILAGGLAFLARHDTESGHVPILVALALLACGARLMRGRLSSWEWTRRRLAWALGLAWAIPLAAVAASAVPGFASKAAAPLVARYRFAAVPVDDVERLAVWCRDHTPRSARFIGPPGPKAFRLWSRRALAFNRAASPYHAEGLADWSARYRDHVGFRGPASSFVRAYQADRHGLERGYETMSDVERAALASRQGATHVVAHPPSNPIPARGPLELLHVEGRYAVYRVRAPEGRPVGREEASQVGMAPLVGQASPRR